MILEDFNNSSSRYYSTAINLVLEDQKKLFKKTGVVEITPKDYSNLRKAYINLMLKDIAFTKKKYSSKYGSIAICCDYRKDIYWRKQIPGASDYKSNRDNLKQNDFDKKAYEYFTAHRNELLDILKHLNLIVMDSITCTFNDKECSIEADDIISFLARKLPQLSLIKSTDKDFNQLASDKIQVYNPIKSELVKVSPREQNEYNIMQCLIGQSKDNIHAIRYETEISQDFIDWMKSKYDVEITQDMVEDIHTKYNNYNLEYSREMNKLDEKEIKEGKRKKKRNLNAFKSPNFGEVTAKKLLESSSLDEILNTNPMYRKRYELNEKLYKLDKLPIEIEKAILDKYNSTEKVFNQAVVQSLFLSLGIDLSLMNEFS